MADNTSGLTIHALEAGSITLPERFFITPNDPDARRTVPSLCFLIQHISATSKVTRIVFDLGLRHPVSEYPPQIQKHCANRQPMTTEPDVIASLAEGGLSVDDIDYVILSHVHYDHIGNPKAFTNPNTKFIIGPGAGALLSGETDLKIGSHSFFEKDLLPADRTIELANPADDQSQPGDLTWQSLGDLLPHAIDLFGDGTLYIVNAPGHLPGHINLLAPRSSPDGPGSIYLAGDACHDMRLFTGSHEIATWTDDQGKSCCIHADIPRAKETLARLRRLVAGEDEKLGEVEVVFAHNWKWEEEAKERRRFWPGHL